MNRRESGDHFALRVRQLKLLPRNLPRFYPAERVQESLTVSIPLMQAIMVLAIWLKVWPDLLIGLGLVRDLLLNKRIHRVYVITLPSLLILHAVVTLIWRSEAAW